jgi:hypothetical protein
MRKNLMTGSDLELSENPPFSIRTGFSVSTVTAGLCNRVCTQDDEPRAPCPDRSSRLEFDLHFVDLAANGSIREA